MGKRKVKSPVPNHIIWRTVRGNRIGFDAKTGEPIIAPKWFKDWWEKGKEKKKKIKRK